MIQEVVKAFIMVFIAEMGDKTQILSMAFATKFPVKKVLLGIFIGSFLNHGIGVLLGSYLSKIIDTSTIQMIAGLAFVGFSLWTLKGDHEDEEVEGVKSKFGPVISVALAFFVGELGDKTQLTAITLATGATYPFIILIGSVSGMLVTGAIGIFVGKKVGNKIPKLWIKLIAAAIFMLVGLIKLYETVPTKYLTITNLSGFSLILIIVVILIVRPMFSKRNERGNSIS